MKQDNSKILKKLGWYSKLVTPGILASISVKGQIIYKDFVPDVVLSVGDVFMYVNDDEKPDIYFTRNPFGVMAYAEYYNNVNRFAVIGSSGVSSIDIARLNSGDLINKNMTFADGRGIMYQNYPSQSDILTGMWTDTLDHFVGMQLEVNNKKYYGWIRCQVFQSPPKLIIKDYAFQNTPRKGIPAGAEFDGDSCVDLHEPNNTRNLASPLLRYIGTHGAIDNPLDKDWYVITVPDGYTNLRAMILNLPADYDLSIYHDNHVIASSKNLGTSNDTVVANNLIAGDYRILVKPKAGVNAPGECYTIVAQTSDHPFKVEHQSEFTDHAINLSIYPNPADQNFIMDFDDRNISDVSVYDILGHLVSYIDESEVGQNNLLTIDCSSWQSGVYMAKAGSAEGTIITKLVVRH